MSVLDLSSQAHALRTVLAADAVIYWHNNNPLLSLPLGVSPQDFQIGSFLPPRIADGIHRFDGRDAQSNIPLELRARLQHRIGTAMFAIDGIQGGILVLWDDHRPSASASASDILHLALAALRSQFYLTDTHVESSHQGVRQMLGIADALPQGVIVVPAGNRPGYVNMVAAGYLGLPPGETEAGVLAAKLSDTASRAINADALRQHLGSFVQEYDQEAICGLIWRFDSVPTALRVTLAPIHPDRASGWLWLLEDVSVAEAKAEELLHAKQEAEQANKAKSQFLSAMSHEVRTPMNGILGMAQLLAKPELQDEKRIQYAQTILSSGQTLMSLLNDILDLSKVEAGKLKLESIAFTVASIVGDIQALFSEPAHVKGLQLASDWHGPTGLCYLGDPYRLRQMLSNLVGNAIKFTAHGFVRILVNEIERDSQHAVLLFSVSDSGIGITHEQQSRLFQPFSQADSSTTRQFGGSGLGLSIVLQLAKLMGGEVGIESELGYGSRFWFRVNVLLQTEAHESIQTTAASVAVPASNLTGTVLIAEDNPVNRMVIMAMLDDLNCPGLAVTIVEDGQQALDYITQGVALPDLVLMDVQMPVMGGLEATEKIRLWQADQGKPRVPIVALTANAFEEDRHKCLDSGMDDFLVKPLDIKKLQATLTRWLA